MTESDAGVLTYAGQAHTVFITQCALMVIKVRMTLGVRKVKKHTTEGNRFFLTRDRQVCPHESLKLHGIKQPPVRGEWGADRVAFVHTQGCDLRQLSGLRDALNLVWMSRTNDWETEANLAFFLHLIKDRAPSRILP